MHMGAMHLPYNEGGADPVAAAAAASSPSNNGQLVQEEGREAGSVALSVYAEYARFIGTAISLVLWAAMFAGQGAYLASDLWLALWSRSGAGSQGDVRSVGNMRKRINSACCRAFFAVVV